MRVISSADIVAGTVKIEHFREIVTRKCKICSKYEIEDDEAIKIVNEANFWVCDKCLNKLRTLISDDLKDDCK